MAVVTRVRISEPTLFFSIIYKKQAQKKHIFYFLNSRIYICMSCMLYIKQDIYSDKKQNIICYNIHSFIISFRGVLLFFLN